MKEKEIDCNHCGHKFKAHINDIYALESKRIQIIAGLLFFIGTLMTIFVLEYILMITTNHYMVLIIGSLLIIPGLAYIIFDRQVYQRVSAFNRVKVRRE
tara:strand:+ start:774 stop:1070 length:297 start_codon:yes stop_codon:yes gene_type:complete